ncbi:hypothetical protein ACRN96_20115 [Shewanella oncorhynchi]|uniref:hypothetical protein n=1 Tax=Shewanella oncorhynchi TaxID=2726434 RepID=UPI003D7B9E8A
MIIAIHWGIFSISTKHLSMLKWSDLGLEYTDETIYLHKAESNDFYGIEGIITETLSNTMDEINYMFDELGIKETYLA